MTALPPFLAGIELSQLFWVEATQGLLPNMGSTVAREHVVQRLFVWRLAEGSQKVAVL
jgi:hypothetical protein